MLDSIDELYTDNDTDDISMSANYIEDIQDRSQIHPDINTIYARFKIGDRIIQTQNE